MWGLDTLKSLNRKRNPVKLSPGLNLEIDTVPAKRRKRVTKQAKARNEARQSEKGR